MQRCFLVVNKETQIASYLQRRSIMEVTEEYRSLAEVNLEQLQIVDVDKFLYIYYQTDDADLSFRSDMNALRTLLNSAFFHVSEALFILVNNQNPLLEDLIHSALRDSPLPRSKVEILQHTGSLMLSDVGKYVSGSAVGQTTTSSYRDVFIREADKEERDRFENKGSDISAVLPVLTDMASLYSQRAGVEAVSAGRSVSESAERPQLVSEFTRLGVATTKTMHTFIVSGEKWTRPERAAGYLVEYFRTQGQRCLVINLNNNVFIGNFVGECTTLSLLDIKSAVTPECAVAVLDARFDQLGFIIEFFRNVKGVEQYIFNVLPEDYTRGCRLIAQLAEKLNTLYVGHYNVESVQSYVDAGLKSTALFLSFEHFKKEFDLQAFKEDLAGTVVAAFPTEDVDYVEFFTFATGGGADD